MTMRQKMIKVLTLCVLVSQVLHVVGKVTVLRGPISYSYSRKLICFSEDDGGALVWNSNLVWKYSSYSFSDRKGDMRFRSVNEFNNDDIDCKMNAYDSCLISWDKHNWNLTDSFKTPMGPVFDQRWEDFEEYTNFKDKYDRVIIQNSTSAALSFSVRVSTDLHMLLCHSSYYDEDFCYWIIIGGWGNRKSVIRKCATGVPQPGKFPSASTNCGIEQVSLNHSPLSATEWRSFVITWNFVTRNISIYDTESVIMTYVDQDVGTKQPYVDYHAFIRSPVAMLLRFHIYDFLYTTVNGAILTSPTFLLNKEKCIQLLVGLCAECEAEVTLRDSVSYEVLERVTAKGSSAIHGLPQWQFVKINKTLSESGYTNVKIELIPKLNSASANPLWAIANIRQCPPHGCLRRGTMSARQDWEDSFYWPDVTCQKLFYEEHTVVNSALSINPALELDEAVCSDGYIGPQCLLSCSYHLDSDFNCLNTAICHRDGCVCSAGLSESTCSTLCKSSTYGYGCKKKCGACLNKGTCNRVTGACDYGCQNAAELYVPPLCQIGIQKPETPVITSRSQTSIRAVVLINWRNEYEDANISYFFSIKKMGGQSTQQLRKRVNQNMTSLIGYFENLEPGTVYQVMCSLSIAQSQINSNWENAETDCNPAESFEVTPQETSVTIDWHKNENQLYSCPPNWYFLLVKNTDTQEELVDESFTYFPYELSRLTPYTSLTVIIRHNYDTLFSKEVHTLEGVPSKVLDLRTLLLSNTQLTLFWMSPEKPNGEIVQYEITLKVEEYYGCRDLNLPTPTNHIITKSTKDITITISGLHPYTSYSVEVTAYNSRHASAAVRTAFKTDISEIPAAIFSQLRIQEWKLLWSPPDDCTTILGPVVAKINIRGVSDAVKDFNQIKKTARNILDLSKINELHGAEWYEVKIYVVRDYTGSENISAYKELIFETLPKAPPPVTNLEVVEVDTRESPAMIHLRWQSPLPPRNGQLRAYFVGFCKNKGKRCSECIEVELDEYCDLWDGYICKAVKETSLYINVGAYNVNVTDPSLPTFVTKKMLDNMTPEAPWNYTFTINDHSVVDLKWMHPWRTGGHLQYFQILIEEISSNLQRRVSRSSSGVKIHRYPVTNYTRNYNVRLYLLPSTDYAISIQAVTIANKTSGSQTVEFQTPPTIDFQSELQVIADESDSTALLNIPHVLNDTSDSVTHIIVKGPNQCKQSSMLPTGLLEQAGLNSYDIVWQAAEISTSKLAGKPFTIGDDKMYGNGRNCPLKSKEMYDIVIMITERSLPNGPIMLIRRISIRIGELPPRHYGAWLISIILLLAVTGAVFYFYRRKRQKSIKQLMWQDEITLSQNFENHEHETKGAISNSRQDLSTPSDRQSLSRATTPDVPPIVIGNNDEDKEMTSLVKVKDFEDYVRQAIQTGSLDKQYETFPRGQTRPWDYGKLPQNKSKNRYGNLIAYDETRVILEKLPDDAHSDYINANYITGYKKEKRYIATQGPKPSTVVDFWRMIWQEKVLIICMLANVIENGKTKCEQYWPDIGKKKKYGDIIVLNAKHNVFADYCFRTFHVTYGEETRKVEHLHYTAWPDHGVPLYTHSVVTYLKKLLATPPGNGPVVVHCSAGVGRTGTIVLCDICLHRAAAEGVVDVFAETASIRRERANMVDNKQQFLLAHLALVECLLTIPTTLPCNETLPTRIKELKKQLSVQQQRLQNTAWQDEALRQVTSPLTLSERNRAKNRFPELISDKMSRIYLKRYPASDEDSDYLSAVYVDGVKLQNQYLATQLPMPSTINDFWRMVAELKVELVLMLQPPDLDDPTCCLIAPAKGEFKPTPYLNITAKETVETEYYTSQKLLLVDNSEKPAREQYVTILCSTKWKPGRNQPPPPVMTMVTFWQAAERIARGDGPTVTLCHDGVTGCGLYLALSFLLERMAVERECDVCLAVRAVRRSRPDFVRPLEHLEYLYDAAITYLEYFETYANFS